MYVLDVPLSDAEFLEKGFRSSRVVPYIRKHEVRHLHRLDAAREWAGRICRWCRQHFVVVTAPTVHQWIFRYYEERVERHRARWHPRLARLDLSFGHNQGVHPFIRHLKVFDGEQLLFVLEHYWLTGLGAR